MSEGPAYELAARIFPLVAENFSAEATAGMRAAMAPALESMTGHGATASTNFSSGFTKGLGTANAGSAVKSQLVQAMTPVHAEMTNQGVTASTKFSSGFGTGLQKANTGSEATKQLGASMQPVKEEMLRQGSESGEKFSTGMLESLKSMAIGIAGFATIKGLFDGIVKGADQLDESMGALKVASENAHVPFETLTESLTKAQAAGAKFGYTNMEIADAYTMLITRTKSVAQSNVELTTAQDYAAVKGGSLADAVDKMNRAYLGNAKSLRDLGIQIPLNASATDRATAVQDYANRIAGQAADKASGLSGRMDALRARVSDLAANVGTVLLPPLKGLVSFFSDNITVITEFAGVMGTLMLASRLLGGSWTDLGAAGNVIRRVFSDFSGSMEELGAKIGIVTGAQREQNIARLADLATIAIEEKNTAALALQKLMDSQATSAASVTEGELAQARLAATETAIAATVATEAEAAATRGLMASILPIGIAMAVVGVAVALFASSATSAAQPTQDLSQQLVALGTASSSAAVGMLAGSKDLQELSNNLIGVGSSAKAFSEAFSGDLSTAQSYYDGLTKAMQQSGDTVVKVYKEIAVAGKGSSGALSPVYESIKQLSAAEDDNKNATGQQDAAVQKLIDTYNDYVKLVPEAKNALDAEAAAAKLAEANAKVLGDSSHVAADAFTMFGLSVDSSTQSLLEFLAKNPSATIGEMASAVVKAAVAVPNLLQGITDHFKQTQDAVTKATQAVTDANNAYAASGRAVESAVRQEDAAKRSLIDANRAVISAQQAIVTANKGVTDAELNLTKAQDADAQSNRDLIQARKDAAQQLEDLHRQVTDQAASELSSQMALYDAQQAAFAAGVDVSHGPVALPTAPLTAENEGQQKAQLALVNAQNAVNDTLATGAKLREQAADADAKGVAGSALVVSATQKVIDAALAVGRAQDAVTTATEGVTTAQYNLTKAQQGVVDARQAVTDAIQSVTDAQQRQAASARSAADAVSALNDANSANSRTLDLNTAAGRANMVQAQDTATAIEDSTASDDVKLGRLHDLGAKYGDINTFANQWIESVAKTNNLKIDFDVTGTASLNTDSLLKSMYPDAGDAFLARMEARASGGAITGQGGPTEDNIPLWASVGEYMHNASAVDYYGLGIMEAINKRAIPREQLIANTAVAQGWDGAALIDHLTGARGYAAGGAIGPTQDYIKSLAGKPYVWGGVGPGSYDCSGLVGEIWARLTGQPSYRRYMTTANEAGFFKPGHGVFTVGLSGEHTAGNLGGLAFEAANPNDGILIGARAQSVDRFPQQLYLPMVGDQFIAGGSGIGGSFSGGVDPSQMSEQMKKITLAANVNVATRAGTYQVLGDLLTGMSGKPMTALPTTPPPATSVPTSGGSNQQLVQRIFASMFGWAGPEWNAAVSLINRESGFRNTVKNPTSTAYGMFQFLDSTWAGYGIPKTSDPTQQSIAGGRYIKARYGDPLNALSHGNSFGWYDSGGWLKPGLLNGTGKPEAVLTPEESAGLRAAVTRQDIRLDSYTIAQLAQAFAFAATQRPVNVNVAQGGPLGAAGL